MTLLAFPFFVFKLGATVLLTLVQAFIFQTGSKKLLATNFVLTLLAVGLGSALWLLPPAGQPATPPLNISLNSAPEIQPLYVTVKTNQLPNILQEYEYAALQQPFVPQYRYVNLAILAAASQQYELASQFEKLARYIDPNQEFFLD